LVNAYSERGELEFQQLNSPTVHGVASFNSAAINLLLNATIWLPLRRHHRQSPHHVIVTAACSIIFFKYVFCFYFGSAAVWTVRFGRAWLAGSAIKIS